MGRPVFSSHYYDVECMRAIHPPPPGGRSVSALAALLVGIGRALGRLALPRELREACRTALAPDLSGVGSRNRGG